MGILFIVLALFSLIVLIVGIVMLLTSRGKTAKYSGEDVGAKIMAEGMDDDEGIEIAHAEMFKGMGKEVEVNASVSFAEIKDAAASGNWRQATPALLLMGGMVGLLIFGALAIFIIMGDKLVGGIVLVVAAYAVIRMLIGFVKA
jgi:hypothetical protein